MTTKRQTSNVERQKSVYHHQQIGLKGEREAESFLLDLGLVLLERRFGCRFGEVDLICAEVDPGNGQITEVVFVEVKARTVNSYGRPEAAVSKAKRLRLMRTAQVYLNEKPVADANVRFDVVSIVYRADGKPDIEHFQDAFGHHELMDVDPWQDPDRHWQ